jgi:hypothetical protein
MHFLEDFKMLHEYIWTAAGTDIEIRWMDKYGWVRPSQQEEYKKKWKYYQELPLRQLDDKAKQEYENLLKKAKVARVK